MIHHACKSRWSECCVAGRLTLISLPSQVKMGTLHRLTAESNCGYSPLLVEALDRARGPDCKEAFNVRKGGVHLNDYSGCPTAFAKVAEPSRTQPRLAP